MHRDHVLTSPPIAHLLGLTHIMPNQGMVIFDPTSAPDLDLDAAPCVAPMSIHVLAVQGYPEFTKSIISKFLDTRVGILGEKLVKEPCLRAGGIPGRRYPDGLASDGVGKVGKVIWGVLGVA